MFMNRPSRPVATSNNIRSNGPANDGRQGIHRIFKTYCHRSQAVSVVITASFVLTAAASFGQSIVNMDGQAGNYLLNPLVIQLGSGSYRVDVIGRSQSGLYDAYSNWEQITCPITSGCPVTSPTTYQGWSTAYIITSPNISSVTIAGRAVAPGPDQGVDWDSDFYYRSPSDAHYGVFDGFVFPSALTALHAGRSSTFVLDAPGPVGFGLREGPTYFSDNLGGLSLKVTPIPEPSTSLMAAMVLASILAKVIRTRPRVAAILSETWQ
jgi:hypothetical protein